MSRAAHGNPASGSRSGDGGSNPIPAGGVQAAALVDIMVDQLSLLTERGLRDLQVALAYEMSFRGDVRESNEEQRALARAAGLPPPPLERPGGPWSVGSRDFGEQNGDFDHVAVEEPEERPSEEEYLEDDRYWDLNHDPPREVEFVRGEDGPRTRWSP